MNPDKKALGRGLKAILQSPETDITSNDISGDFIAGAVAEIPIKDISPNPFQPRSVFLEEGLEELANTIKSQGIVQPISVRKMGYNTYQIISGERRFRASRMVGLEKIPAYIMVASDQQMLEMTLVENIQREELNPIDIAQSYLRLTEECSLTHEELSSKVGKSRTSITNFLRLLKLPEKIQDSLCKREISMGHARPLIGLEDEKAQLKIFQQILSNGLSVREVEAIVHNNSGGKETVKTKTPPLPKSFVDCKNTLTKSLDTKIQLNRNNKGKGKLVISFNSDEDFERIIAMITQGH